MKAVDFINENLNPITILNYYHFRNITETDDSIRSCCEIHKGNNPTAFMWNKSNNLWYCYTGDCHGGDVFTLVQKMEDVDFIESVKRTADILGIDITGMKIQKQSDIVMKNTMKWLETMKKINKRESCYVTYHYELPFTQFRTFHETFTRFSEDVLNFYQAKFCTIYPLDDGLLYNKLVIPIYFNAVLRGVALRDTTGRYQPKWLYQPKNLLIRDILYNYDVAMETIKKNKLTEIILVEGIFDVWAYHIIGIDNVVAVFGSSLKKEQGNLLLKSGLDLILSFDNDDAGNKCTKEVTENYKYKVGIKTINLPEHCDPGDLKSEELTKCYLERR